MQHQVIFAPKYLREVGKQFDLGKELLEFLRCNIRLDIQSGAITFVKKLTFLL